MNIANKLTVLRVLLIPVFLILLYLDLNYIALAVFIIASITDYVDGKLARERNLVTDFGKFMDPLADKILVFAALIWFTAIGVFPAWALVIVAAREFAVSGLRMLAASSGKVIAAAWSGKVKTATTMVCIIIMFLPLGNVVNTICTACIVVATVYSGIEYFVKNKGVLSMNNL